MKKIYGKNIKRYVVMIGIILCFICLFSCKKNSNDTDNNEYDQIKQDNKNNVDEEIDGNDDAKEKSKEDIIILYTNDIHCAATENIGFAGLAAYKKDMEKDNKYVSLVDVGDTLYSGEQNTEYEGQYMVDIMNEVGYDVAVVGNHELDGGMNTLQGLIRNSKATYVGCNMSYIGKNKDTLSDVKPYKVIEYGDVSVAYIGVTTPRAMILDKQGNLKENGLIVYDYKGDPYNKKDTGEEFYKCIQEQVDECRDSGVDYVILLSHLGNKDGHAPFSSIKVAENTEGIDVILDAHAHNVIPCMIKKNPNGENVIISSTGERMQNIGQLTITGKGNLSTSLISEYNEKDTEITEYVSQIRKKK